MNFMKKKYVLLLLLSLATTIVFAQAKTESLKINWPDEYNWTIGSDQNSEKEHLIELVPEKQDITNWKTLGSMLVYKGVKGIPIDTVPGAIFKTAQTSAIGPQLTIFEKDSQAKYPWIIFKIESAAFKNTPEPESQLYYVIQGETALYINFVAVKEKTLPEDMVKKWIKVFKASELVYQ
jgi:hypothetical protein